MWGGADERDSIAAIQASIDEGVTLIDTAPAYGFGRSEEVVGKAIAGRRDEVVLSTKCGLVWDTDRGGHFFDAEGHVVHRYLGRDSIDREIEASLRRLRTDVIDIYVTHWQDPTTPIAETMGALEDLRAAGKIRAIAASNVTPADVGRVPPRRVASTASRSATTPWTASSRTSSSRSASSAASRSCRTPRWRSGILSGKVTPERVFAGDDQRAHEPALLAGEPRQGGRDAAPARSALRGAGRHDGAAGHRLDARSTRHHLRPVRRPDAGPRRRERQGRDRCSCRRTPSRPWTRSSTRMCPAWPDAMRSTASRPHAVDSRDRAHLRDRARSRLDAALAGRAAGRPHRRRGHQRRRPVPRARPAGRAA